MTPEERAFAERMIFEYRMLDSWGVDLLDEQAIAEAMPYVRSTFLWQWANAAINVKGFWWRLQDWLARLAAPEEGA